MFPYNAENRPESKTMRMFRPVRQAAAPGAKSAVSDCIMLSYTDRQSQTLIAIPLSATGAGGRWVEPSGRTGAGGAGFFLPSTG